MGILIRVKLEWGDYYDVTGGDPVLYSQFIWKIYHACPNTTKEVNIISEKYQDNDKFIPNCALSDVNWK